MPMTIIRRINLNASPFSPVMDSRYPGNIFYYNPPAASTSLRKVSVGAGADTLVTNALPAEAGNLRPASFTNTGYYCINRSPYNPGSIVFVNVDTGVVTTHAYIDPGVGDVIQPGPITQPQFPNKVWNIMSGGTFQSIWEATPPAAPVNTTGVSIAGTLQNPVTRDLVNIQGQNGGNNVFSTAAVVHPGTIYGLWGNSIFLTRLRFAVTDSLGGNPVTRLTHNGYLPSFFKGFGYGDAQAGDIGAPFFFAGVGYRTTDAHLMFYGFPRGNIQYPIDTGIAMAASGWHMDSIDAEMKDFHRVYWSCQLAGPMGFRLFGSSMFSTKATFNYFVDLDTGPSPNSINGIFVVAPFIYVLKSAGVTYGPQLVIVHDPELERRNAGRKGNELWNIIPEIGRYLP